MALKEPLTDLDERFSSPGASPREWEEAREGLEGAAVYWLSTVRPDGRPHVTPLLAVWAEDALHFCTGPDERKAKNLADNPHCVLTTGTNRQEGLDLVLEGDAVRVTDDARLRRLAAAWEAKYGSDWHFDVGDGVFTHEAGEARVYEVVPSTVFGFGKGEVFSQTAWRF